MSKKQNKTTILIIAGETSGDMRGAPLVRAMKKKRPDLEFVGIGGDHMAEAGVELLYHVRETSILGFFEVVKHLPFIRKMLQELLDVVKSRKPVMVLLIDYPGFNLRFAKRMYRLNVPVCYYISPQVWAWGNDRVKKIVKWIGRMIVVFPFELDIYKKEGMDVHFTGHPLRDEVKPSFSKSAFFKSSGLNTKHPALGLLPGSRKQEVSELLPPMMDACKILKEKIPDLQIILGKAPDLPAEFYKEYLSIDKIQLIENKTYDVMAHSDTVLVASGTATLETGLLGTPMVIVYKMSPVSYFIGKNIVKLKNIGLVNIVAGETVVPERLQNEVNGSCLAETAYPMLTDTSVQKSCQDKLKNVQNKLGEPGASKRAAECVLDYLTQVEQVS